MIFENKPSLVWTVLGSCLAICFHNERLKIGAIVHAQLPERKVSHLKCHEKCPVKCLNDGPDDSPYKYVECSIRNVLDIFKKEGISANEIDIKLFGGASLIGIDSHIKSVGLQNIEKAFSVIEEHRLKVVSENIGGEQGRKIFFLTDTGEVYLKKLIKNG